MKKTIKTIKTIKIRTIQEAYSAVKALRRMGYTDFSDWIRSKNEGNRFYNLTPIRYWGGSGYAEVQFSASFPDWIWFNVLKKKYLKRYY